MVVLRRPKRVGRNGTDDLGDHRAAPMGFGPGRGRQCGVALGLALTEDGGAVLGAHVVALTVEGGGVVNGEEDVEQGGERQGGRIERDLHHLGMAGAAAAHGLVAGGGHVAAAVAGGDGPHRGKLLEDGLEAPDTTYFFYAIFGTFSTVSH